MGEYVDQALRAILLGVFDRKYFAALRIGPMGYGDRRCIKFIEHLYNVHEKNNSY